MTDMAVVIGGDAADIELDLPLFQGDQGRFLAGLGVVDFYTHGLFRRLDNPLLRFNKEKKLSVR